MAEDWSLQDFLALGALPGAVPSARLHTRSIRWEWGLTPLLSDAAEQVVSELVTNSVTAARAMPQIQPVRLWLLSDTRTVLVLAWDASPQPPTLTDVGDDAESGRGLFLVAAFSERWETYSTPQKQAARSSGPCAARPQTSSPVPPEEVRCLTNLPIPALVRHHAAHMRASVHATPEGHEPPDQHPEPPNYNHQ